MEKQIIALGPADRKSYIVTLPIDWVRAKRLDKTRKADVTVVDNAVIVRPFTKEPNKAVIDAATMPQGLGRALQLLYKRGVDEIKVTHATPKIVKHVADIVEQRCIGFEIIENERDIVIIKDVARDSAEDFQALLRRCFLIVIQLAQEKDPEQFANLDKSLNKITAYCERLLVRNGYAEFDKVNLYIRLCNELERLGDEYKAASKEKERVSPACLAHFKLVYDLFYNFSDEKFEHACGLIRLNNYYERAIIVRIRTITGIVYGLRAIEHK